MDSLSYRTKSAKKEEVSRNWYVFDAENAVVGRMCSQIATMLRGKHKPSYTPHVDTGDYIVVINADKVRFTGSKMKDKTYITFSGYPGGQKKKTAEEVMEKHPIRIVESAVKGMLPKNTLGRQMFKKLFVYAGSDHPHGAQQPEPYKL